MGKTIGVLLELTKSTEKKKEEERRVRPDFCSCGQGASSKRGGASNFFAGFSRGNSWNTDHVIRSRDQEP